VATDHTVPAFAVGEGGGGGEEDEDGCQDGPAVGVEAGQEALDVAVEDRIAPFAWEGFSARATDCTQQRRSPMPL
jgi:hypothetical protein